MQKPGLDHVLVEVRLLAAELLLDDLLKLLLDLAIGDLDAAVGGLAQDPARQQRIGLGGVGELLVGSGRWSRGPP